MNTKKEIYKWCVKNNITRDWFLNAYFPETLVVIDEYCEMMNIPDFTKGFVMSLFDIYKNISIKNDDEITAERYTILIKSLDLTYLESSQYLYRLKTLINNVKNDKY